MMTDLAVRGFCSWRWTWFSFWTSTSPSRAGSLAGEDWIMPSDDIPVKGYLSWLTRFSFQTSTSPAGEPAGEDWIVL